MSKKSSGSPQVHRERLSMLIKALKETKGEVNYRDKIYDLQGIKSNLNYKTFILDVTDMSESAFNKYFDPKIEQNSAYSTSGKTFKEPADFIHSIMPYLTIDGGPEDRTNPLHIDGAFSFKNNRPQMPDDITIETDFGPVALRANQPINQDKLSLQYYNYIDSVCSNLFELFVNPTKISEIFPSEQLQYGKFIDEYKNEPNSEFKIIVPVFLPLSSTIYKRYQDLLYSEEVTESILPGYKGTIHSHSSKQLGESYKNKFKVQIKDLNLSDYSVDELIDYRYELMWVAKNFNYEYEDWSPELKSLMLIVNLEESSFIKLVLGLSLFLLAHTKFTIVSSSDGIKPIYRNNDYSLSELTDVLNKYQIDSLEKDFTDNLRNLISKPIQLITVIERAKSDSLQPQLVSHIHTLLLKLYSEKIDKDFNSSEKNKNSELLLKVLSEIK